MTGPFSLTAIMQFGIYERNRRLLNKTRTLFLLGDLGDTISETLRKHVSCCHQVLPNGMRVEVTCTAP